MSFNYRRFNSILQKETKHILCDPFTLMLALFVPLMIVLILGNSIEFNLKEISTVVVDHDHTKESTELIHTFNSSNYFKTYFKDSPDEAFREILRENARVVLYIPPDFDKNISAGKIAEAQILLDGANSNTVNAVNSYLSKIINKKYADFERDIIDSFAVQSGVKFEMVYDSGACCRDNFACLHFDYFTYDLQRI